LPSPSTELQKAGAGNSQQKTQKEEMDDHPASADRAKQQEF